MSANMTFMWFLLTFLLMDIWNVIIQARVLLETLMAYFTLKILFITKWCNLYILACIWHGFEGIVCPIYCFMINRYQFSWFFKSNWNLLSRYNNLCVSLVFSWFVSFVHIPVIDMLKYQKIKIEFMRWFWKSISWLGLENCVTRLKILSVFKMTSWNQNKERWIRNPIK